MTHLTFFSFFRSDKSRNFSEKNHSLRFALDNDHDLFPWLFIYSNSLEKKQCN
jgi:hypothetical protein